MTDPWWKLVWTGIAVAVIALIWIVIALIAASSEALTAPSMVALAGAVTSGVGVFGPLVQGRRQRRRK